SLAGEPLRGELVRGLRRVAPGARVFNLYGPTESTTYATGCEVTDPDAITIGRPITGTELMIVDDRLRPVPPGEIGEICLAGAGLARGYLNRPGLTAERFVPNPFGAAGSRMYRTGDLGRFLSSGEVEFHGRMDFQVKVRGFRVELGEVEAALLGCTGVSDAVVTAVRHGAEADPRLVAYVVGEAAEEEGIRRRLAAELPHFMIPSAFVFLDALPLTPTGKIDRNALPPVAPEPAEPDPVAALPAADVTARQAGLCRLAARVLHHARVDPDDDFYALGGNSLSAAELAAAVRAELGAELRVDDILRHPTPAGWAARLDFRGHTRPPVGPLPRPTPLPASYAQQNLWLVDQLEGPSPRYNEPFALRLRGPLDVAALRAALTAVVARHEALRTVLELADDVVVQRIVPADRVDLPCPVVEVTGADLPAALRDAVGRTFDLARDLPVRAGLFRLVDGAGPVDTHVLLVVVHHVACDGSSAAPFWRDLAAAYDTPSALPPAPPVQYADFALWQRDLLHPDRDRHDLVRRQSRFWSTALAGMPELIGLPTDRPRTTHRTATGAAVPLRVPRSLHLGLAALARAHRATVFTVVHAALTALLARRGAGPDVVVGAVVSGRVDPALDDLVGFFANTVVLRVDAGGDPTFLRLLERAKETGLAALANQDLPFERVVELVNPTRTFAYSPLVQVMLAFQVRPVRPPALPGLETSFEPVDTGLTQFDLCFQVVEQVDADDAPGGITGSVSFATDILDRTTVVDLVDDLLGILASVVERPDTRISAPELASAPASA
ncbi:condensation domain-containing protein, partial [Micromonospora sp. NPDC023956]|uniref:condensation domain-containing protein n=1 Tax=Micromonospora sp. NPDC023956 TaxID=3155722 RepID=UPI0033E3F24F